jgi:hypothetical protein
MGFRIHVPTTYDRLLKLLIGPNLGLLEFIGWNVKCVSETIGLLEHIVAPGLSGPQSPPETAVELEAEWTPGAGRLCSSELSGLQEKEDYVLQS